MAIKRQQHRGWLYASKGDYHRKLDKNWSYTPTYLQKVTLVGEFIESLPRGAKILDIGCGEGVFVEKYQSMGRDIKGVDLNYESELVQRGNVCKLPFDDNFFDAILFLDALEHLSFSEQPIALSEIYRVLRPNAMLLLSVPNLAHLNSRAAFFMAGKLDRTDNEIDHLGERPIWENRRLLKEAHFDILGCKGVTFSLPFIYRRIICRHAARFRWLHDVFEPLARALPSLAMLNFFTCQKPSGFPKYGKISDLERRKIIKATNNQNVFSIFTHMTEKERLLLFESSQGLPVGSVIVEIGSYLGSSTSFLAGGIKERSGKVYAIDSWTNIAMSEGKRDTYAQFLQNTSGLRDWIISLRGSSTEIAKKFDKKIDLLFIDADHSYDGCLADWHAYSSLLSENAVVIMHDIGWAQGVQRVVEEEIRPEVEQEGRLPNMWWGQMHK